MARVHVDREQPPWTTFFDCCLMCGGTVVPLLLRRSPVAFARVWWKSLVTPIGQRTLLVCTAILWAALALRHVMAGLWLPLLLVACPLYWVLALAIIENGSGRRVDGRLNLVTLAKPVLRCCVLSLAMAALAYWVRLSRAQYTVWHQDTVLWAGVFLIAGALPSLLIPLANDRPVLEAISPRQLWLRIETLGADYVRVALISALVCSICFWWASASRFGRWSGIAILPTILDAFVVYASLVLPGTLGVLLSTRGDAVGFGLPQDALSPALPDAEPIGKIEESARARSTLDSPH